MAAVGNASGTSSSFLPFRSASRSCGGSSSLPGNGGAECLGHAAAKVAELHVRGLRVVGLKRDQDPLGDYDVFRLHGFLVMKLECLDGNSHRYLRLDWGDEGLAWQEEASESKLMTYMQAKESAGRTRGTGAGVAFNTVLTVGSFAWWATATTAAGAFGAALVCGCSTAVIPAFVAAYAYEEAEEAHRLASYQDVPDPARALLRLHQILKELQAAQQPYSVSTWNCNHFANHVAAKMLDAFAVPPALLDAVAPALLVEFNVSVDEFNKGALVRKTLAACMQLSQGQPFTLLEKSATIVDRLERNIVPEFDNPAMVRQQISRFPLTFRMEILLLERQRHLSGICCASCLDGLRTRAELRRSAHVKWLRRA